MKHGLSDSTVEKIRGVLARHPEVERAVLYGSRAKGTAKKGSDIDLTLHGGPGLNGAALGRIHHELDDLLLPYGLDVSIFSDIEDAAVREHIRRVGVVFYSKTDTPPTR